MRKSAPRLLALLILPGGIVTGCGGGGGGGSDAPDATPDPFTFIDRTNVAVSTVITSNAVAITGIDAPASISVTGGTYSLGCGTTFTAAAGTISNNQTVCVRHTSAVTASAVTDTTVTVGGVADTFRSTTATPVAPTLVWGQTNWDQSNWQ